MSTTTSLLTTSTSMILILLLGTPNAALPHSHTTHGSHFYVSEGALNQEYKIL
jgi:hypothetical protein